MNTTAILLPKKATDLQEERMARDIAICREYDKLTARPGQSRTEVIKYLMAKYNIHSTGTIYAIRKRVEERTAMAGKRR